MDGTGGVVGTTHVLRKYAASLIGWRVLHFAFRLVEAFVSDHYERNEARNTPFTNELHPLQYFPESSRHLIFTATNYNTEYLRK